MTEDLAKGFDETSQAQSNFAEGQFWEQGLFAVLPSIASMAATPERLRAGLELSRDYMHSKGITIGNEPGGILSSPVWQWLYQPNARVVDAADVEILWTILWASNKPARTTI